MNCINNMVTIQQTDVLRKTHTHEATNREPLEHRYKFCMNHFHINFKHDDDAKQTMETYQANLKKMESTDLLR
jgi:hypothetical protein